MLTIHRFAPAKVNLYLHVTGKRVDGYHLLDSLAVFPKVGDTLAAAPADTLGLTLAGRFGASLQAEPDNLVLRAARALCANGAAITLEKNLPIASGIGGGSADAAAALNALSALWGIKADLPAIALSLGADVPVCLTSTPARMSGIGEILSPVPPLPPCGMLLANPGIAVPTPAVFRARTGPFTPPAALPDRWPDAEKLASFLKSCTNDLQAPAISLAPAIGEVLAALKALPGCLLARMSGSGATCFALFNTPEEAATQAATLPSAWWTWGGGLYEPSPPDL